MLLSYNIVRIHLATYITIKVMDLPFVKVLYLKFITSVDDMYIL
jgi:hypothetical protein